MYVKTFLFLVLLSTAPPPGTNRNSEPQQEPDTFIPTEKLPADYAVSFPVDI